MTRNPNLLSTPQPPSQCPPIRSLHAKSGKPLFSSTPPNLVDLMLYCAPELAPALKKLFQLSYNLGIFPSFRKLAHVFLIPKKVKNLTLQTIALLQSLLSSLRLWRPLSPNNCLPSLKQTTFFHTISMGLDKPDLPGTF